MNHNFVQVYNDMLRVWRLFYYYPMIEIVQITKLTLDVVKNAPKTTI